MKAQEIIKEIMKSEGLSQYALSSMCAMKRTTLESVLLDDKRMRTDTIYRFVKALGGAIEIGGRVMSEEFTEKDALKDMMREGGYTQASLAEACGYKARQNVSAAFGNKTHLRLDTLLRMTHAMGGKVMIICGEEYEVTE